MLVQYAGCPEGMVNPTTCKDRVILSPILSLLVFMYYNVNVPGQGTLWDKLFGFNQTFTKWTGGLKISSETKLIIQKTSYPKEKIEELTLYVSYIHQPHYKVKTDST